MMNMLSLSVHDCTKQQHGVRKASGDQLATESPV